MALKGTDIVKRMPEAGKKNCKECGFPTCFAFAMKLAGGGTTVEKCPHLSNEVRADLLEALAPPIKPVTIGTGANLLKIGDEEVMYRHEKTFIHQPGIGVLISDKDSDEVVDSKIKKLQELQYPWVGVTLKANLVALHNESGDKARYLALAKKISAIADFPFILVSEDTETLLAANSIFVGKNPLLYPVTKNNIDQIIFSIKASPVPVAVKADSVEALVPLTTKLKDAGIQDIVLDPSSTNFADGVKDQMLIRRASLKQNFRALGYPTVAFPCFMTKDATRQIILASMYVIKYAGVIVLSDLNQNSLLPLLVQRLNIYTDPRIPMSVEEKVYKIGEPDENSPVLITCNWALTYFIVASEVESSRVPSWLCVKDTEGLGVLTAWAAGKFGGDTIGPFIKRSNVESLVKHRKLIIPGRAARIKGELQETLPDWEIIIGPKEAAEIPGYLPVLVKKWKN